MDILAMTAQQRLDSILWQAQFRSFVTYSGGQPATCFTEATLAGLQFLISQRGYQPWGLVLDRQSVYDAGGGPVWYARPENVQLIRQSVPEVQEWLVRLDPRSDWLEEREWRVPVPSGANPSASVLPLASLTLVAILVGDPNWAPIRHGWHVLPDTSQPAYQPVVPGASVGVPRWWWDPAAGQLRALPPWA